MKNNSSSPNKDISTRLLEKKVISEDQLQIALKEQQKTRGEKTIATILVEMGFISEGALGEILSESTGIKKFDIRAAMIDSKLVKKIPKEFANHNKLIAVSSTEDSVNIAMADIFDIVAVDQIRRCFPPNFKIIPVYATEVDILSAIDQYYGYEMSIEGILKEIEGAKDSQNINDESQLRGDYRSPMVRLVDSILTDAVHRGASDLHFEPENSFLRIRYRIDGKMVQIRSIHKEYWSAIAVRIKIMSGMNIAESRKPQDGRVQSEILGLDEKQSILTIDKLGFSERNELVLKTMVQRPEGVIILTGPTGSGKTTTLYTILNYINSIDKNIMTLEDPVEYRIPLVRQSNIRADAGMDFASGIRALLRQDPDVILVGEIRDTDTAITAIQAAMTGHQVYTSLHTNDAISAIPRLMNMGVPNYLMSGSLIGVIAQRLARKLCQSCKEEYQINEFEKNLLGEKNQHISKLYRSKGCEKCSNNGYKGRVAIIEIISFDRELDDMISNSASRKDMIKYLLSTGFVPMVEDGIDKVIAGITDLKELIRVVDMTDRMMNNKVTKTVEIKTIATPNQIHSNIHKKESVAIITKETVKKPVQNQHPIHKSEPLNINKEIRTEPKKPNS